MPTGHWLGWLLLLAACGDDPPAAPKKQQAPAATETLMIVDGVTITFADLAPQLAFLDTLYPEYNVRIKVQKVLTQFTLPLLFARREFATERAHQLELARTLRAAVGNVEELERQTTGLDRRRSRVTAADVDLPLAPFLFDPTQTGAVSEPTEVPQGYVVAGAFALHPAAEVIKTECDALQVAFVTLRAQQWDTWLEQLRARLADRVTYVHPDYRLAMPPWLKLP